MRRLNLKIWIFHHLISSAESLAKVLARPFTSLMIWLAIGVSLAFPIGGALLFKNFEELTGKISYMPSITVFLERDIDETNGRLIADGVGGYKYIEEIEFLTSDEALIELGNGTGLGDLLSELEKNPIPATLFLTLEEHVSHVEAEDLMAKLRSTPGVSEVIFDSVWLERLKNFIVLGYRILFLIAVLLGSAAMSVVFNLVRMSIDSCREEVAVVKLVGGSKAFASRPFIYIGLWYGLGGGLVASLIVSLAESVVGVPARSLLASYGSSHVLIGLNPMDAVTLTIFGGVLGLLGAWASVARYIGAIEP